MTATLAELAARFDCRLVGDGAARVSRVGTLASAGPDAVSFLANPHYRDRLAATRAAAVVLDGAEADACPAACLVSDNPYAAYARIAAFLHPPRRLRPGVDPSAVVAADARVAASAEIGAQAVVGRGSVIGDGASVGAGTVVGSGVSIGAATRLGPRVSVLDGVQIGERCIVHSGAVIGADGFGFAPDAGCWVKVPQVGGVRIGNDVEIGANTTVDRGAIEDTVIEDGVKLDNLVQIAHNVRVGAHTVMAAMSGAAGSTTIGRRCMIGGGVVIVGHVTICDDAVFLFRSVVTKSVEQAGVYAGSLPAEEAVRWRRNAARFKGLDALAKRLGGIERKLGAGKRNKK
jgi:UDP-3-O-[3-hydroxymyristoyl] glucosamine N-acyltransferase